MGRSLGIGGGKWQILTPAGTLCVALHLLVQVPAGFMMLKRGYELLDLPHVIRLGDTPIRLCLPHKRKKIIQGRLQGSIGDRRFEIGDWPSWLHDPHALELIQYKLFALREKLLEFLLASGVAFEEIPGPRLGRGD